MSSLRRRYHLLKENEKHIIDLEEAIAIKSIEDNFGFEILYMSPIGSDELNGKESFKMSNTHMLLQVDKFGNQNLESLDLSEAIKWVIRNGLDELFEKEFKKDSDLTNLKLIN